MRHILPIQIPPKNAGSYWPDTDTDTRIGAALLSRAQTQPESCITIDSRSKCNSFYTPSSLITSPQWLHIPQAL